MPMNFPDMNSLIKTAKIHKFRELHTEESEEDFRKSLALHVYPIDRIESFEILFKVGWDQWTDDQKHKSFLGLFG